ncbi:GNAT family N-acetyltransferase [Metapseudomonas otitidis]|uniref:GNAT family N-acetyltransferase n=1 Tax=Metapseudomonas otitidis TaxID=319939 RepID=UPI003217CC81
MSDAPLQLHHLEADEPALRAAFGLMHQLRPRLVDAEAFVQRVARQRQQGYRLLAASQDGRLLGLAGYRTLDNLIHDRFVYVDDLVTAEEARSQGVGAALLTEVERLARADGCAKLVLDTALANALAQRFYFRQGLLATGLHFSRFLT